MLIQTHGTCHPSAHEMASKMGLLCAKVNGSPPGICSQNSSEKKRRKPPECNWKLSSVTNVLRWQYSETNFSLLSRRYQIEFGFYKRNILIMLQSGQLKQNWYRNIIKHHFSVAVFQRCKYHYATAKQSMNWISWTAVISTQENNISDSDFTCLSSLNVLPFHTDNTWHHLQAEESMTFFDLITEP